MSLLGHLEAKPGRKLNLPGARLTKGEGRLREIPVVPQWNPLTPGYLKGYRMARV